MLNRVCRGSTRHRSDLTTEDSDGWTHASSHPSRSLSRLERRGADVDIVFVVDRPVIGLTSRISRGRLGWMDSMDSSHLSHRSLTLLERRGVPVAPGFVGRWTQICETHLSCTCLEKQHNVGFGLQAGGLSGDTPCEPQKATLSGRMNSVDGLWCLELTRISGTRPLGGVGRCR
jgi:hypothetical protein